MHFLPEGGAFAIEGAPYLFNIEMKQGQLLYQTTAFYCISTLNNTRVQGQRFDCKKLHAPFVSFLQNPFIFRKYGVIIKRPNKFHKK